MNQEHRQLQDQNWTHVEQLKSTDKREKVLEDQKHVWNTQENNMLHPLTENHEW